MSNKLQAGRRLQHDSIEHVEASQSSNHEGKCKQDGQHGRV